MFSSSYRMPVLPAEGRLSYDIQLVKVDILRKHLPRIPPNP